MTNTPKHGREEPKTYRGPHPCQRHAIEGCVACDEQVPVYTTTAPAPPQEVEGEEKLVVHYPSIEDPPFSIMGSKELESAPTPQEPGPVSEVVERLENQLANLDPHSSYYVDFQDAIAHIRSLEKEIEEARKSYERVQKDRAALLDIKSTDGLSSSEWVMRTAKAEAEVKLERARAEVENARLREVLEKIDALTPVGDADIIQMVEALIGIHHLATIEARD